MANINVDLTVVDGKIIQEVPMNVIEARRAAIVKKIEEIDSTVIQLNANKAILGQRIVEIDAVISEVNK